MKLQPYIEKLNSSPAYKDFHKKNNDAFVVAGFFILDFEMGNNIHQIDYYVPSKKKIAAFSLDKQINLQLLDMLNSKVPEKLDIKTKVDLDQLQGILEEEMKNRSITEEIKKIIAVLQCLEGKKIWNLNCILSGMGILSAHVEDETRTVLKMEKKSLMDIMKKIPAGALKQQMPSTGNPGNTEGAEGTNQDEVKEKLKKLDDLAKEIEKEKDELQKEASEKEAVKLPKKKIIITAPVKQTEMSAKSAKPAKKAKK
jgi:hypothetical protein